MNDVTNFKRTRPRRIGTKVSVPVGRMIKNRHSAINKPDRWLIAKISRALPEAQALDVLVNRHWKQLFARCQLLTVNPEEASRLAQSTWQRMLQTRLTLNPCEDFRTRLYETATDLWREQNRPLQSTVAVQANGIFNFDVTQLTSLPSISLEELKSLSEGDQIRLEKKIDAALRSLTPKDRDALLSHFLDNTSPGSEVDSRTYQTS